MSLQTSPATKGDMHAGQRLHCEKCGSEIEIVTPCTCNPSNQSFRCCGQDMTPSVGKDVHVGVE